MEFWKWGGIGFFSFFGSPLRQMRAMPRFFELGFASVELDLESFTAHQGRLRNAFHRFVTRCRDKLRRAVTQRRAGWYACAIECREVPPRVACSNTDMPAARGNLEPKSPTTQRTIACRGLAGDVMAKSIWQAFPCRKDRLGFLDDLRGTLRTNERKLNYCDTLHSLSPTGSQALLGNPMLQAPPAEVHCD